MPLGSILGPLLFLLLIMINQTAHIKLDYFCTDDISCLINLPPNVDHSVEIYTECTKLALWFSVNFLVLDVSKCNYVHFSLKHLDITYPLLYLNKRTVKCVDCPKFLGYFIDLKLNWHTNIEKIVLKMC